MYHVLLTSTLTENVCRKQSWLPTLIYFTRLFCSLVYIGSEILLRVWKVLDLVPLVPLSPLFGIYITKDWNDSLRCRGVGKLPMTPIFKFKGMITHRWKRVVGTFPMTPLFAYTFPSKKVKNWIQWREKREGKNKKGLPIDPNTCWSWFHASFDWYAQDVAYKSLFMQKWGQ